MLVRRALSSPRRRAAAAVVTAVTLPVLMGFAALAVDVGVIQNARNDLQAAADAAALAAAATLTEADVGSNLEQSMQAAREEAERFITLNTVLGKTLLVDSDSVVFGRSYIDEDAGTYSFVPSTVLPDSVRVHVGFGEGTPNGPLPLFFAGIFGKTSTEVMAEATAVVVPRDIAVVADMSASHNDDSELQHYQLTTINMHGMWDQLPGGADEDGGGLWDLDDIPAEWVQEDGSIPQAAGPGWGYFQKLGFGTEEIDSSYQPYYDDGLVKLQYKKDWNDAALESYLAERGYSSGEINALMSDNYDSNGAYEYRTAVALGFADWNSGQSGGRWESQGVPPSETGNGNSYVSGGETVWTQTIFDNNLSQSEDIWRDYIDNYVRSSSTTMYHANSSFRYRFGIKTFVNYLLEKRAENSKTPEFASAPQQPMQAVKDAVGYLTTLLTDAGSNDLVSLESYGTWGRHEVDLTNEFHLLSDRLDAMQAGHYDPYTNMGGGIERGIEELLSSRARPSAKKVLVVLTDGNANINEYGSYSTYGGKQYALDAAQDAADENIYIFTVSVGADSDVETMEQIAEIGGGMHFHATGSIDEYSAQLEQIFLTIGGIRAVQLVQ